MRCSRGSRDPSPISGSVAETQPAKEARRARFRALSRARAWKLWQISGRGLGYHYYMMRALPASLSSRQTQASWLFWGGVLGFFLVPGRGKGVVTAFYRSFQVVQLARPKSGSGSWLPTGDAEDERREELQMTFAKARRTVSGGSKTTWSGAPFEKCPATSLTNPAQNGGAWSFANADRSVATTAGSSSRRGGDARIAEPNRSSVLLAPAEIGRDQPLVNKGRAWTPF